MLIGKLCSYALQIMNEGSIAIGSSSKCVNDILHRFVCGCCEKVLDVFRHGDRYDLGSRSEDVDFEHDLNWEDFTVLFVGHLMLKLKII